MEKLLIDMGLLREQVAGLQELVINSYVQTPPESEAGSGATAGGTSVPNEHVPRSNHPENGTATAVAPRDQANHYPDTNAQQGPVNDKHGGFRNNSSKAKKGTNRQQSSPKIATLTVNIQPWLSSTVWDHGPTMSFTQTSRSSRKSAQPERRAQTVHKQPDKVRPSARAPQQPPKATSTARQSGRQANQNARPNDQPVTAGVQPGGPADQPSALGGTKKPGPARNTVRDKWASMPQFAGCHQTSSQLGGTRPSGPVLETVRSRWAGRHIQKPTRTTSENTNSDNQHLN
jgi:hypothetical protein